MKHRMHLLLVMVFLASLLVGGIPWAKAEQVMDWELLVPEGAVIKEPLKLAPRIATLEGKTIGLRWNGKPNGEILLNRVADLLKEKVTTVKIIKFYEVDRSTIHTSPPGPPQYSIEAEAKFIKEKYKPDLVIGSQAD